MSESTIFEGSRKAASTKKADAGHVRGAARYRLTPQLIAAWHQRIGASEIDGKNLPRPACSADSGASDFISAMSVEPLHGSELQQHIFWRTLGVTSVFALLRTPCTTARTAELIERHRSDYVLVATQQLPVSGQIRHGSHTYSFRQSDRLLMVDNRSPFEVETFSISDSVGIWVPTELLGDGFQTGQQSLAPIVMGSTLGSAIAAFLVTFVQEAAVRGKHIDSDTEMSVVDLIRTAIRQSDLRSLRGAVDACFAPDNALFAQVAARRVTDRNYWDSDFDVDVLARRLYLSRRQLYRYLTPSGQSPAEMIVERRLECARELLSGEADISIARLAQFSGFPSANALRNRFRSRYGVTPQEFRRRLQANDDIAGLIRDDGGVSG